ncbi:CHC2 zinc finger domain-containing protein [Niabella hibiscisoli]|uniref:CHC2 zinc finger domain-containing protein n=1 Tax=Niabella hibiscisoli TaxID=1825928 RepID=UPI001F0E2D9B|nr:CHC2 zinc finger domain-containing protein [Niabella hibiscisoli]MCH5719186.1 CHC2 zinc finger domain-containing protein [Niabella hibiscisoli]
MTIKDAKAIDMVRYLSTIGHEPSKIRGDDYWFYSPFRTEHTPSFKVNRKLNKWFDFEEGKGASLIDLLLALEDTSIPEMLARLERFQLPVATRTTPLKRSMELRSPIPVHYLTVRLLIIVTAAEFPVKLPINICVKQTKPTGLNPTTL